MKNILNYFEYRSENIKPYKIYDESRLSFKFSTKIWWNSKNFLLQSDRGKQTLLERFVM